MLPGPASPEKLDALMNVRRPRFAGKGRGRPLPCRLSRAASALCTLALVAAGCGGGGDTSSGPTTTRAVTTTAGRAATSKGGDDGKQRCGDGQPPGTARTLSARARVLREGDGSTPRVEAVVYPRPEYEGCPWSQWGQGVMLDDGRHVSAIGDHRGRDGNAYFYEFDPTSSTLRLIGDVLSATGHQEGAWGYGKVHGQLVPAGDGVVHAMTYWGSSRGLTFGDGYEGDRLLRVDVERREVESIDVPMPRYGVPSLAGTADGRLLYGEAVDPQADGKQGAFFAYDTRQREVILRGDDARHDGFRNVLVDADGDAYVSAGDRKLVRYDRSRNRLEPHPHQLPGAWLRSSTRPGPDGSVYGVTADPDVVFALRPDGTIDELGPARGETASIALHPSGDRAFYVPDAHGHAWEQGSPLVAVDVETGRDEVVVALNEMAERELGLRLGGSYNVAATRDRVYIGFNAGPAGGESFGEVVLVIVHL